MLRFGKYQLIRKLATGGMAEVYLATATAARGLRKLVVIKKIHAAFADSRHFVNQFIAEAKIALSLNHPNIVQVFDFGQVGDTYFLAMEHVDGPDLMRLLTACRQQRHRIPYGLVAYIGQQACMGLDYAHRKVDDFGAPLELVHRDVSPQNLLISYDGAVRVVDFGIARARDTVERTGTVKGKFAYMSPEQAAAADVDHRSDIFSLATILYELATDQPLFSTKKRRGVAAEVLNAVIPRPSALDPGFPPQLEAILLKALARDREDRHDTARDLQNELTRFLHDQTTIHDAGRLAALVASVAPRHSAPLTELTAADQETADVVIQRPATLGLRRHYGRREHKNVVLIAGVLDGIDSVRRDVGDRRARQLVADFLQVAEHVAFKHEAKVQRIEEVSFLLLLGVPVSTEDDSCRAVRIARALADALDGVVRDLERRPNLRFGIQRGEAQLVTSAQDEVGIEVSAETLAIAEHLAAAAMPGEVLVGGGLYRMARDDFSFEPLPEPLRAGGAPLKAYRLVGPLPLSARISSSSEDIVGRELELRYVSAAFRSAVEQKRGRIIAVLGHTGLGKRTLLSAFLRELDPQSITVLRAAGRPAQQDGPLAIVRDLVREMLRLPEQPSGREVRDRIEHVMSALTAVTSDERALIRNTLLALFKIRRDDGSSDRGDPAKRSPALLGSVLRLHGLVTATRLLLLHLTPRRTIVYHVSNLHFADIHSAEALVRIVADSPGPAVGLVTAQPTDELRRLLERAHAEIIELRELGPRRSSRLLLRRLVDDDSSRALAQEIFSRTGGNPLFINEMVESLIERGLLQPDRATPERLRWARPDEPLSVPTTVEGVLASRLDALPAALHSTLTCAAVLGSHFSAALLDRVVGSPSREALQQLARRGLLTAEDRAGARYVFVNHLTWEVARNALAPAERRRLHQRAASRIVSAPGYRPGLHDGEVARHLELAGDAALALQSYLSAARWARSIHADADALRLFGCALRLAPATSPLAFTLRADREEILASWGRQRQRLREIRQMRRIGDQLADDAAQATTANRLAALFLDLARPDRAVTVIEEAKAQASAAGDRAALAESSRLLARARHATGDCAGAIAAVEEGLDCATSDPALLLQQADLRATKGALLFSTGELRAALSAFAEAALIYHRLGRPDAESATLERMGNTTLGLGEVETALAHHRRALKIAQRAGDRVGMAKRLTSIGHALAELGARDRALPYLSKALQLNVALGDFVAAANALISTGQIQLRAGNYPAAGQLLAKGRLLAEETGDRYQLVRATIYLAQHALAMDQPDRALKHALQAYKLASEGNVLAGTAHALATEGSARLALGESELALRRTAAAISIVEQNAIEGAIEVYAQALVVLEASGRSAERAATLSAARDLIWRQATNLRQPRWRQRFLESEPVRSLLAAADTPTTPSPAAEKFAPGPRRP